MLLHTKAATGPPSESPIQQETRTVSWEFSVLLLPALSLSIISSVTPYKICCPVCHVADFKSRTDPASIHLKPFESMDFNSENILLSTFLPPQPLTDKQPLQGMVRGPR